MFFSKTTLEKIKKIEEISATGAPIAPMASSTTIKNKYFDPKKIKKKGINNGLAKLG